MIEEDLPTLDYFLSVTNAVCGLDIRENTRKREYIYSRTLFYALCRKYTSYAYDAIGKVVGKDHSTILHAMKNVDVNVIKNTDGLFSEKWQRAVDIIENISSDNKKLKKYDMKIQLQILNNQNQKLIERIMEIEYKINLTDDENLLIELYRNLNDQERKFIILKAQSNIKMKEDEKRKLQEIERNQQKRELGFNSYLSDAKI